MQLIRHQIRFYQYVVRTSYPLFKAVHCILIDLRTMNVQTFCTGHSSHSSPIDSRSLSDSVCSWFPSISGKAEPGPRPLSSVRGGIPPSFVRPESPSATACLLFLLRKPVDPGTGTLENDHSYVMGFGSICGLPLTSLHFFSITILQTGSSCSTSCSLNLRKGKLVGWQFIIDYLVSQFVS